jgi:tartrate dehydrogenase/decarboxylase/D-malate dehydrogenase
VGLAAQVPPRIRPVHQPAPGAPVRRRALLAGRKPGDIDYYVVRENTEGEYTALGGIMFEGTDREICIQESVYSKHGAERLLKYAFDLAQSRAKKHVTLATKSNGIAISMPWWDKRADDVAKAYPKSRWTSSTSTS